MYKFTGFTEKANAALNSAIEVAESLGHSYVGSEHLLAGLLRSDGGAACLALNARGIGSEDVENVLKSAEATFKALATEATLCVWVAVC